MPRLSAKRRIVKAIEGEIGLSAEQWFDLTMLATGGTPIGDLTKAEWEGGDRELAERRHNRALERAMDRQRIENSR